MALSEVPRTLLQLGGEGIDKIGHVDASEQYRLLPGRSKQLLNIIERNNKLNREETTIKENFIRRKVAADLIETTPDANGLWYWIMASPCLLFIAWLWVDIFAYYSPISSYSIDIIVGLIFFIILIVLPAGYIAHFCVTALPGLFQHAGWDVQPLEEVTLAEQYMVRYKYETRHRSQNSWHRIWIRSAQGWFYLEIVAIFAGALLVIPLYLSAAEFGFGQ